MAHAQKPDSVFQRNGRVHLYRRGCQFSRVLAFLECGSAENDCSNTGWTVPSQAEDCWLPTPFASFPFTSPPERRRVPPDSVSTLPPLPSYVFVTSSGTSSSERTTAPRLGATELLATLRICTSVAGCVNQLAFFAQDLPS